MNKKLKILVCILSASLLFSLLYIYKTNLSVEEQIKTNDNLRNKINKIDEFQNDVTNMSIMSKYYIITDNNKYKISFEKNYNSALIDLDELQNSDYISNEDKYLLEENLKQYNDLTCQHSIAVRNDADSVNDNTESILLKLTDIESSLIEETSDALPKSIEKISTISDTAKSLVDSQNSLLQIIGGFITMVLISPIYFLKKNSVLVTDAIKGFISNHIKKNQNNLEPDNKPEKEFSKCDDEMVNCVNSGLIKNLETMISERELMVSTLKMIYSHNQYMKDEWTKAKVSLDSIEQDLLDLKKELNILMNKSDIPYEKINLLENKLLEIRFLLEKLPQYHDFIMELIDKK
ncbi:MAG: hypothetical protein Q4F66_01885 [Clostridium sp.]|nr:hypothetical protein [Clostridium sp.]